MSLSGASSGTVEPMESNNKTRHNSHDEDPDPAQKRLVIAVDFGTTYSAVSYVAIHEGMSLEEAKVSIRSIRNYPDCWTYSPGDQMHVEVPTEVIYPVNPNFRSEECKAQQRHTPSPNGQSSTVPEAFMGENFGIDMRDVTEGVWDHEQNMFSPDAEDDQFFWGYQVHARWSLPETHSDSQKRPLSRFKLLLDNSAGTADIRQELEATLTVLRERRILDKSPLQVIADFLTHLLQHTKTELVDTGYDDTYKTEFVLCVPAIWTQKACRDMQSCLADAMHRAHFSGVDAQHGSIDNLFIVSEPEAAAEYVLSTDRSLKRGDVFVLLDAGGGTVDANTYRISQESPLRLSEEIVPPGGGLHGSSYLNESFRAYLRQLLADETYLEREDGTETINSIIEAIMIDHFEYRLKRTFNCFETAPRKEIQIHVAGLRDNPRKRFRRGAICIPVNKITELFLQRADGICAIMEEQIRGAMQSGNTVNKVVLIGGFSASVSLKGCLIRWLNRFNLQNQTKIQLHLPGNDATIVNAVASGAVLRALNKENGPRRKARSSYGLLRAEPFMDYEEHRGEKAYVDRHDKLPYIRNTIDWVLKLGSEVPPVWECEPIWCSHTFDISPRIPLLCKEVLYVSDRSTMSHYRATHVFNQGAEEVGEIVVDFTYLREQGLISPIEASKAENGKVIKRHYKVEYLMTIRVVDRDLQCEAVYEGQVKQTCRINIASGFRPGTK